MRIFITGCAKSGTTLLRRLFLAFKGTDVIDYEIRLYEFLVMSNRGGILVGKRYYDDLLSAAIPDNDLLKAVSHVLNNPHIKIVNIYRDGRDVVESGITPSRWIASIRQMLNYQGLIAFNVRYEDLVKNPNAVQDIISNHLKLDSKHKFSDYPKFFHEDDVDEISKYVPREISTDRIGKNLDFYKTKVQNDEERRVFENLLRSLGYAD